MKYIIGTEYIVIGRRDWNDLPWIITTTIHLADAQVASRNAEAEAKKNDRPLITKIETRTLFNSDIPPAPAKNVVKEEVVHEA